MKRKGRLSIFNILAVSVLLIPAVIFLYGCNVRQKPADEDDAGKTEKVKLQIAVFEGGYGREYWDAVCEAFEEENQDIEVVMQTSFQIGEIIRPSIIAGNPPDFVYLSSDDSSGITSTLIKDRALTDITDVMEGVEDKILPGFVETKNCQPYGDGKIYLAPMYYSAMGMWYNKNFFEENDLKVPETWDEFFALGEDERTKGRKLFAYPGIYPSYMGCIILASIASSGGADAIDDCLSYEEGAWRDEDVRNVLNNIAKIGTEGYLLEGSVLMDHTQVQSEWLQGKALFIPAGSWIEKEMLRAQREEDFRYGFAAAPVVQQNDNDRYVYTRIEEMYIPADAKNVDAAKKFLAFQYSDTAIELNAKYAHGIPPVKGAVEKLRNHTSDAVYESYKIFEQGYKPYIGDFSTVVGTNIVPGDSFYTQIGEVMLGTKSVDEWIEEMENVSNQVRDSKIE